MRIPICFLGTSQAVPTEKRNHTAMLLQYKSEVLLIDCGEGTQRQFRKAKLNPCKLTRILITHWHGDHILGIPGLLQTLMLNGYNKTLKVYGPHGTKRFMNLMLKLFVKVGKIKIEVSEIFSGKVFDTSDFSVLALPMQHGAPCLAYSFIEKDKIRIDKKRLKQLKIPSSPLLSQLQQGKEIRLNGRTIKSKQVTYKEKGKKITFILDTKINPNCIKISKDSDLLISESTYTESESSLAFEYKHLTAKQAGEIAKKSESKKLILTHISQRYDNKENIILKEAKKVFPNTILAEDLMKIEV